MLIVKSMVRVNIQILLNPQITKFHAHTKYSLISRSSFRTWHIHPRRMTAVATPTSFRPQGSWTHTRLLDSAEIGQNFASLVRNSDGFYSCRRGVPIANGETGMHLHVDFASTDPGAIQMPVLADRISGHNTGRVHRIVFLSHWPIEAQITVAHIEEHKRWVSVPASNSNLSSSK